MCDVVLAFDCRGFNVCGLDVFQDFWGDGENQVKSHPLLCASVPCVEPVFVAAGPTLQGTRVSSLPCLFFGSSKLLRRSETGPGSQRNHRGGGKV